MISRLDLGIISTHNLKTIGVLDTSIYNNDIAIEEVTLEILVPGFKYPALPFFMSKSLNVFNSNSVGITKASCEDELIELPDGLWKFKYSICPNDKLFVEKIFLKIDKIESLLDEAFLTLEFSEVGLEQFNFMMDKLKEIEIFIHGAVAAANKNNYKLASDLYKKSKSKLNSYLELNSLSCRC